MGDNTTVAINYTVVGDQCTTMESLSTKAEKLQRELDDLKAALKSNWVGTDAKFLTDNYSEFVANIETITRDINSVKDWCNDTMTLFKGTSSKNSSNIASAMSGK